MRRRKDQEAAGQTSHEAAAVWVPVADLRPWDKNPRLNEPTVSKVADSIKRFGFGAPLLARRDGELIAGHTRLKAAGKLGLDRVPVGVLDLDPADARLLALADNKLAEIAEWDEALLAEVLGEFEAEDAVIAGFGTDELADLLDKLDPPGLQGGETDLDELPEPPADPITRPGDLWILGRHRLHCADSTDAKAVTRLMGGGMAHAAITSPPYTDQREYGLGKFDWLSLMNGTFDQVTANLAPDGHILVNLGPSHKDRRVDRYWDPWLDHAEAQGWPLYGWYVWDKGSGMPGAWNGRLAPAHEFVFHFTKATASANKWIETQGRDEGGHRFRQKDGSLKPATSPDKIGQPFKVPDSVIRVGREASRGIHTQGHPAVFPVEFAEFLIKTWTQPGQIVHEPFSGAGTTILACEQTGRACRAMEIEPRYCDLAVLRWERLTGKKAQLEAGAT